MGNSNCCAPKAEENCWTAPDGNIVEMSMEKDKLSSTVVSQVEIEAPAIEEFHTHLKSDSPSKPDASPEKQHDKKDPSTMTLAEQLAHQAILNKEKSEKRRIKKEAAEAAEAAKGDSEKKPDVSKMTLQEQVVYQNELNKKKCEEKRLQKELKEAMAAKMGKKEEEKPQDPETMTFVDQIKQQLEKKAKKKEEELNA